jgi:hypothetical protein
MDRQVVPYLDQRARAMLHLPRTSWLVVVRMTKLESEEQLEACEEVHKPVEGPRYPGFPLPEPGCTSEVGQGYQ